MKLSISVCLLVVAVSAAAVAGEETDSVKVRITLLDNSSVIGQTKLEAFEVRTGFGNLVVPFNNVSRIDCDSPFWCELRITFSDMILVGNVEMPSISVTSESLGELMLRGDQISRITRE